MKNIFGIGLLVVMVALFSACNNDSNNSSSEDTPNEELTKTRSMKASASMELRKEIASKAGSMASFKKGARMMEFNLEELGQLNAENVNLVVLYDTDAPWAEVFNSGDVTKTGDDKFNGLLQEFDLAIIKQFELDEMNEGLVLEPNVQIEDAVAAAREISMIDYVLMVHVKEVEKEDLSALND